MLSEEGVVFLLFAAFFFFEEGEGIFFPESFLELSSSKEGLEANPVTTSNKEGEAAFCFIRLLLLSVAFNLERVHQEGESSTCAVSGTAGKSLWDSCGIS